MDRQQLIHALAAMTDQEYREVATEARGEARPQALKDRAAQALRDYTT